MARYLADAFFPLELILKLFALGNFEHLPGKLKVYFNNLYIIIVWFIYFSFAIYLEYQKFICRDIIGFMMFNSKLFAVMLTVMSFQYYKQTWKRCLDKITMINDTLERLNIPNKYQNLHNRIKRNILIWILISVGVNVTELSWFKDNLKEIKPYIIIFVINHPSVACNVMHMKYESVIWYTASIFEKMNKYILHLSTNKNNDSKTTRTSAAFKGSNNQRLIDTPHHKQSLLTIMHVHLELSKTCYEFHKTFQIQLIIEMVIQFIYIMGFVQAQYIYFSFTLSYMFDFTPVVFSAATSLLKVIFINNTIEKCRTKAKHTEHALHILRDFTHDPERQEEIFQFILQITQKLLKFSGLGLFDFGHHFVYKIALSLFSNLTISQINCERCGTCIKLLHIIVSGGRCSEMSTS